MAPGGKRETGEVKRGVLLLLALLSLAGCSALNDSLVRFWFQDLDLSEKVNSQIREGLGKRMSAPEPALPKIPAPPSLDQG